MIFLKIVWLETSKTTSVGAVRWSPSDPLGIFQMFWIRPWGIYKFSFYPQQKWNFCADSLLQLLLLQDRSKFLFISELKKVWENSILTPRRPIRKVNPGARFAANGLFGESTDWEFQNSQQRFLRCRAPGRLVK